MLIGIEFLFKCGNLEVQNEDDIMLRFLLDILEKYGLDSVQIAIICIFGWKLATNHLKHLKEKIDEIHKKVNEFDKELNDTKERVSKLEGKVE